MSSVMLLVCGSLIALALLAIGIGKLCWIFGTRRLRARLEAGRLAIVPDRYRSAELASLPASVQRYFQRALPNGQPMVTAVSVRHIGTFNLGTEVERWKAFTSTQRVITRRPGFDWDARIRVMPGVAVHVHDAYLTGEGWLHAAVLGVVPLANLRGPGALAEGELMRFLAEAVWYPTALLPSQGVRWEAVDEHRARATLQDGAVTVTLQVGFSDDGMIEQVRAEARGRMVDGAVVMAPWEGRFWNYAVRAGMRVPLEAEVAWVLPEGTKPYWRGRITQVSYEFADARTRTTDRMVVDSPQKQTNQDHVGPAATPPADARADACADA